MWSVYILKSLKANRYYIGYTSNLERRLNWHNSGLTKSTKFGIPWIIVYNEQFDSKLEAIRREKQVKSYKGGNAFKRLIGGVA